MDKKNPLGKRLMKTKGHPPPGDFIALGSKQDTKAAASVGPVRKPSVSLGTSSTKRDAPISAASSSLTTKKPKLSSSQTFTPLGRPEEKKSAPVSTSSSVVHQYEEIALEVEPENLMDGVMEAEADGDDEKIERLLCGAVKYLKNNRAKPESSLFLTLMYLAKTRPQVYHNSEVVTEAFCSLLKRDVSLNFKTKGNALVSVLACNTLMAAFSLERNWPETFLKVFLEDSLGERVWVDRADCRAFSENITTGFSTKMPKPYVGSLETGRPDQSPTSSTSHSPVPGSFTAEDDDRSLESYESLDRPSSSLGQDQEVFPRYTYQQVSVEMHVVEVIKEQLNRRQLMDGGSRNLVKVMTACCGYSEIRMLAAQRLEMWLQNPKLTRPAQDLLMGVCLNCDQHSPLDIEVLSLLSKVRLKTKPLVNHYLLAMREALNQHVDNMRTLMTHTIYNELSNSRNPNNMALLQAMFQHNSELAAKMMAEIFQDLLCNRDDYLRALRALLREIVRSLRHDMNFTNLALGLMTSRTERKFTDMEAALKERLLHSITDLITLTSLLSISPLVRETFTSFARGEYKDVEALFAFQSQAAIIQRDAVTWLHSVVPGMFDAKPQELNFCLRKVLFMEKMEQYYKLDNWPPEGDRGLMLRIVSEVPVLEDSLMRVLIMGLNKDFFPNPPDALDLADQMVRRAAIVNHEGHEVLKITRTKLFDAVFNLCAYRPPDNIVLPKGYTPPAYAISNHYWKAWAMLLVISSFNPSTIGKAAWDTYPTLQCFMQMIMTNNFKFPPPTMAADEQQAEDIRGRERQISELERQQILEFEDYLASVTITEANSLLLAQLTTLDPVGVARKPPPGVLEQLRSLNQSLQLGAMLCRCRDPDFLLDIIHTQGTSQSMPWLADLVESSDSSLDVLPVQCLCEFLLHDDPLSVNSHNDDDDDKHERQKKKQKIKKQEQLLARLQALLHSSDGNNRSAIVEVLNYFLNRLSSQQTSSRLLAVKGLSMVLSKSHLSHLMPSEEDEDSDVMEIDDNPATAIIPSHRWLLELLPSLLQFKSIKETVCSALRQACQVETDAAAVSAYIVFLSQHSIDLQLQAMDELLVDLGQLIVERPTLINHLLPIEGVTDERSNLVLVAMINMFYGYLERAQQPQEGYMWSNQTDQVLLQWTNGKSATMNILVVHAMIILLTYAKPTGESKYEDLLQNWFPKDGLPPTAYLVDTSEEALLLPDWLKLRMIRSSNLRLVDAALVDLEAGQLLLFVQSFGIPVQSMSRLLACLDRAVDVDGSAMEEAVVDRGYMAQLIEVQHMRGATGGDKFHRTLVPDEDELNEMDTGPPKPQRRQRSLSTLTKTQETKATQLDKDGVVAALTKVFHSPTTSSVERRDMHRTLLQGLSKEPHFWKTVLKAFQKLGAQENFVQSLCEQPNQTSALLRIIISKHGAKGISNGLVDVLKAINQVLPDKVTSLSSLVKSVLAKHERVTLKDDVKQQLDSLRKDAKTTEGLLQTVVLIEDTQKSPLLEKYVQQCISESVEGQRSKQCTASLTAAALVETERVPQNLSGLLVDWLSVLDANIVSQCPDLQMEMLFAKQQKTVAKENSMETGEVEPKGRRTMPYLLALLTHQGSWTSLHRCIQLLLCDSRVQDRFDSSCVLDFLWACLHIPRIWQGRDKKPTKNYKAEDVLHLTEDQIKAVVFYILLEASNVESDGSQNISALAAEAIDKRMMLLMACCCNRGSLIKATFDCLHQKLKSDKKDWNLCHHLLVQLYLRAPHMSGLYSDTQYSQSSDLQTARGGFSQLDSLSHHLLTTLGNTGHGAKTENAMLDANIACRKLAAQHPVLMLRQMPLIASLLQGKAQFSFGEIKHQNGLTLFTLILNLLELLQPYIFHPSYSSFNDVLESYFDLIKNHGLMNRQLGSVTVKFVQLLLNFMSSDSTRASRILHKYNGILNYLTSTYPDFPALKSLLTGLALPQQEINNDDTDGTTSSSSQVTLTPVRPGSPWSVAQLQPFQNKLQKSTSVENTLTVLNDLDDASKRRVDILEHFVGDMTRLMRHNAPAVRDLAHSLVMRYIRHDPGSSTQFLNVFLQCLDSEDQDIVNAALRNLPEFAVLAQEHAVTILQKAFLVSINSKVDATSTLTETLQLLNMETVQ